MATYTEKLVKLGCVVPESLRYACKQTDRQTDTSQYSAPLPGRSKMTEGIKQSTQIDNSPNSAFTLATCCHTS